MQQRSDEWFAARLGKATASRFGDIMAVGRNGAPLAGYKNYKAQLVIERLSGKPMESYQSAAMQKGVELEPLARTYYSLETGNDVEECGFIAHKSLEAGASPDGLIGETGVLEIKVPNPATHIETLRSMAIPKPYYWQMMGQMWLTGCAWAHYASFCPEMPANARLLIIKLESDAEAIKALQSSVEKFLAEVEEDMRFIQAFKGGADLFSGSQGAPPHGTDRATQGTKTYTATGLQSKSVQPKHQKQH